MFDRREIFALAALAALAACRVAPAPTLRRVALPAGRIAYRERGRGPAALFLHGFPLSSYQWRDVIAGLADERRCIAPDFLGLGETEVASGQAVDPFAQTEMIVALMNALDIDRADLVASDSGGAVAQLLIARHRSRVRTVLLANCDSEGDSPPAALLPVIELAKRGRFVSDWLAPWHASPARARAADGLGGMCYADARHPTDAAIAAYLGPLVARPALTHAYAIALEQNALAGIGPALARSGVPARIVWGTADPIFALRGGVALAAAFGEASRGLRELAGSKLFWPEERPEIVIEEARRLWQS